MPIYCEYSTLTDLRASGITGGAQIDLAGTKDDAFLLGLIRSVSRQMDLGGRWFFPQIVTRHYDRAGGRQLDFPETDFLEVTTVTNGDGTVIASTSYDLLPYDFLPYYAVRLKLTSGLVWLVDSSGNSERALTVLGVAGFNKDYPNGWVQDTATIQNNPLTAGGTSLTGLTTGRIVAGQLLKLGTGNDYAYVSSVVVAATDTATVIRSVNGSTGIAHAQNEIISVWHPGYDLEDLCRRAVQALYKLRANPLGDTIVVPGMGSFSTPKDVGKWIMSQMVEGGFQQPY